MCSVRFFGTTKKKTKFFWEAVGEIVGGKS